MHEEYVLVTKLREKDTFYMLQDNISQCLPLAAPLCMVHLLEVPLEITGDDDRYSYFWVGRPDMMQ